MATWPDTLPQSFQGGGDYQETPANTVLRTTMDTGVTKLRRRQTRSESFVQGTMIFSPAQAVTFMTFFEETLRGGSIVFNGALTRTGTTQNYFFQEEPILNHIGGETYQVFMRLVVLP